MEAVETVDLPALELLESEIVCPECHYTYHRHQAACTNCKADW